VTRVAGRRGEVHELLLDDHRTGAVESRMGISAQGVAKHLDKLRSDGLLVQAGPLFAAITATHHGPGGLMVEYHHGWVLGVAVPKQIEPDAAGPKGSTDWLMIAAPRFAGVVRWLHMRGCRISERSVAGRLDPAHRSHARPVTLALSCSTGLEAVLERPLEADHVDR
jgi:hypothetical protein